MSRSLSLPDRTDLIAMLRLATPIVIVQVGLMLMGVVDTMVVGRLSAQALAAVALGNLGVFAISAFGLGLLMTLDPLVAQAVGADDRPSIRRSVQRGLILAVALTIPSGLILSLGEVILPLLRQQPEIIPIAAGYARICIFGLLPFFSFIVLRQTLQAMEQVRPIVAIIVIANIFNLGLDWILVFGFGPVPSFGALGSAWATTASRWLVLIGLAVLARHHLRPLLWPIDRDSLRFAPLWRMVVLGAPIGLQIQLEFATFGVIALLMGGMGTVEMAANQVAINLSSLTFMVPLGIGGAAAVRVGHAIGAGNIDSARRAAAAALVCGAGFMTLTASAFITAPGLLAATYTSVDEVLLLAAVLIPIAGVFQVFDGLQVVSIGVLRGLGDTKAPVVVNVLGFWLIGMPVSLVLAFHLDLGPPGLWWGLVVGLATVAGFLLLRISWRFRQGIDRVELD